jgi:hypothetical protein
MKNKIGTKIRLEKIADNPSSGILEEKYPVGHLVEGILLNKIEEGTPIKLLHLKHELNKLYGLFHSTNIEKVESTDDLNWTLTTRNSVYTVREINDDEKNNFISDD